MITNPLAFNALKWQDRRNVLMQMAGSLSDEAIAAGNKEYENLLAQLTQGKTLEDYKKQISASIKKAKDDIKSIPARIDEVERSKPAAQDFPALKLDLETKEDQLKSIDGQLQNNSFAFDEKLKETNIKKLRANGIKSDIAAKDQAAGREADSRLVNDNTALNNFRTALTEKEAELATANNGITTLTSKQTGIKNQISVLDGSITAKREEWNTENAKTLSFDDAAFCCPTCKRDFEAGDVEAKKTELTTNFRNDKASKLSSIQQQGQSLATEKANLEAEVTSLTSRIESGTAIKNKLITEVELLKGNIEIEQDKTNNTAELPSLEAIIESLLSADKAYQDLKALLVQIEATIEEVPQVDNSALLTQKDNFTKEILMLRSALRNEEQINAANIRIDQLTEEESKLAQQIADVEKIHFTIESFNKLKIDALENKINSRFQMVKFKMFDTQINGGETETCEPMINGVPFSDANTASRINAGLDIINTLCQFYEVTAPVFLDNRESVIRLIDTESQLVNLIVSEQHKTLTVGAEQLQHAVA